MCEGVTCDREGVYPKLTCIHLHFLKTAMVTVTAGLRCPPDTPPDARIPIIRPNPYPKAMLRKVPVFPSVVSSVTYLK